MQEEILQTISLCLSVVPNNTELWAGLAGAMLGAVMGGMISFTIQRRTLEHSKTMQEEMIKENKTLQFEILKQNISMKNEEIFKQEKVFSASLIFKISRIASEISQFNRLIENAYKYASEEGNPDQPWLGFQPMAAIGAPVGFTSDEASILINSVNKSTFYYVLRLDQLRNYIADGIALAGKIKLERFRF